MSKQIHREIQQKKKLGPQGFHSAPKFSLWLLQTFHAARETKLTPAPAPGHGAGAGGGAGGFATVSTKVSAFLSDPSVQHLEKHMSFEAKTLIFRKNPPKGCRHGN